MTGGTAPSWRVLELAHDALRSVVGAVSDDQWAAPTPCREWNAAQVLRHAVGDQHAYAAAVTGEAGLAEDQFAPAPDPPDDPVAYTDTALARSAAAFARVLPGADVPTPWPGSMPAELVVAACSLDGAVHAWDLARATGQPSPLTDELAGLLAPTAPAYVEPLRAFYAPALAPEPDDSPARALLRYVGRDPAWASPRPHRHLTTTEAR